MPTFNISISPAQSEYVLKPNATIIQAYDIYNNSSEDIYLNTEVLPFLPQGNNGSVTYENITSNPQINFSLNNSDLVLGQPFNLPANSKKQLVLKIKTLPEINLDDSYFTFFVYQTKNQYQINNTQATGKIGSHILLSVSNTEQIASKGEVSLFKIFPKIKDVFFTPIKFSGEIRNDTSYFLKTNGKLLITKNEKNIKEINLQPNNVLANYYRQINCQDLTNCTLKGPFWPGRYTASLSFDENLHIPNQSLSFFIFPISPILFLLLTTFIILFSIKLKKHFKKKAAKC